MSVRNLHALLEPESVVVVGASNRSGTVGNIAWRNLRGGGFKGTTTPVNPHHRALDGVPVLHRCGDLRSPHDLAIVCTGASTLATAIEELAAAGTRAAILLTSDVDAALRQSPLDLARPTTMRLLGPDGLGLLSPHIGLNAGVAHANAIAGDIALVSQSSTLASTILDQCTARNVGFSHLVCIGDQMDVDAGDLLDHLGSDAATRVIVLAIETVTSSRKFMSAARAAARNKPVIVLKTGHAQVRHASGPDPDAVFDAAIRRAGMLRVHTLQDLFLALQAMTRLDIDVSRGLTIVANGRGAAGLAVDHAATLGVALTQPPTARTAAPEISGIVVRSHANPLCLDRQATPAEHAGALKEVLSERLAGAVLFMHAPNAAVSGFDVARACLPLLATAPRRVLACWPEGLAAAQARLVFEEARIADFDTPEEAVQAFAMLAAHRRSQAMLLEAPSRNPHGAPDKARAQAIVFEAIAAGLRVLDEVDSLALLAAYGVPVARTLRARATAEDAVLVADQVGYPVALKVLSRDLDGKTEAAALRLDVADETTLRRTVRELLGCVGGLRPDVRIEGFAVQAMSPRSPTSDLSAHADVDATFGPVIGIGPGRLTDASARQFAWGLPPLNRVLARDVIAGTHAAGHASPGGGDDELADILVALSRMQADLPEVLGVELDPIRVGARGAEVLDGRVRLAIEQVAGTARFAILPFPDDLTEHVDWQGRTIVIRAIRPEDEAMHRAFIAHVSQDDLRLRFFSSRRELPRTELARLVQIDYAREMAFIALDIASDGSAETLGVARAVCDPDNVEAEFAILVRTDVQGHRLGTTLFSKLIRYLQERGTNRIVGYVLRENQSMRHLVESLGFEVASLTKEPGAIYYVLELKPSSEPQ